MATHRAIVSLLAAACLATPAVAQDLQPRRWSHLPVDSHFGGFAYAYTSADISLNPALQIEDATLDLHTVALSYVRSFELLGRSARFDLVQAYQYGRWEGLLQGSRASTSRTGLADTVARFSVNLLGAPPLEGGDFARYRESVKDCETIVGTGLAIHLPTGRYLKDRLINLGNNRYTIRPQLGMVHNRGPWSFELTGSGWFFTDNTSFNQGNELGQDPLYTVQAHLVHTFRPGLWLAVGAGYGTGGEVEVNGRGSNNGSNNLIWGASLGLPIDRSTGIKLTYIQTRSFERTGLDSHTLSLGASRMW